MAPSFVTRYLIALDQHKLIALASFALVTGISGVVALQPPPPVSYKAQGTLVYTTPPQVFSETGGQILEQGRQLTKELLLADNVVEAVAAQVKIPPKEIRKRTDMSLPKSGGKRKGNDTGGGTIAVVYADENDKRAAVVLGLLMQKMVEQSRLINTERLRAIIESIEQRIPEARDELRQAEQQLERYNRVEGPALFAAQDGTLVGGITGSQNQQRQILITLQGLDAQIASLSQRLGLTADQAYTSSALSADPTISSLRGQINQMDTQIEILRNQGYRDAHPNIAMLLDQKRVYETMLQQRAAEVIGGKGIGAALTPSRISADSSLDPARQQLANQLINLETQRDTLVEQLEATKRTEQQLRREYQALPNKQLEQARLQQQVTLKQGYYNRYQTSLADAKAAEIETVSSLALAQAPEVAKVGGEGSNPAIILGAGALIGLLVGGGVILVLSTLDSTLHTAEDIRSMLAQNDVTILGDLPFVNILTPDQGETGILAQPDSPYMEYYERFRSNLRRAGAKSPKVVLLISTVENEGKTVSAYNLAIASAQAGKRTLLVEADLRSPSKADALNIITDPHASIEPLRYYSSSSGYIRLAPNIENLYVVPSPGPQRQAAAIVESSELKRLLEDARVRFDFVVVDSPALSRCNDALLLDPLTDGMVIVTRPGHSQGNILNETLQEFIEAELRILGAIINGIDKPVPVSYGDDVEIDKEQETVYDTTDLEVEHDAPTEAMRF